MLDDLKFIHQRDGQDALGVAEKQWQQLGHDYKIDKLEGPFSNIVFAGMGGSALAALLTRTWPGYGLPFEVVRQYHLPAYVRPSTLVMVCSYSGNTEEALSMLAEAEKADAHIVVITSGGKLKEIAEAKNYPLAVLPDGLQPRHTVLYQFKAIIDILSAAGLLQDDQAADKLAKAADFLKNAVQPWLPTVPEKNNPAKELALDIAGKSPAIYGGPLMAPAAYKWKINFHENAKSVAWWNELPEFDHNELIGWSSHPPQKPYEIINLVSSFEHPRVLKRFEVAEKLLSGRRPAAHKVEAQGSNVLEHLLYCMVFGDFVSLYLALANNLNPTPVELVEKFKLELDK